MFENVQNQKPKDTQKGHGAMEPWKLWCYILQSLVSYLDPHQHWWGDTSGSTRSRHSPGGFEMPWLKAPGPTLPGVSNPKGLLLDFQLNGHPASDTFTKLPVVRVEGYFFPESATNIFSKQRKVLVKVDDISFVDLESLKLGEAARNHVRHVADPSTSKGSCGI